MFERAVGEHREGEDSGAEVHGARGALLRLLAAEGAAKAVEGRSEVPACDRDGARRVGRQKDFQAESPMRKRSASRALKSSP